MIVMIGKKMKASSVSAAVMVGPVTLWLVFFVAVPLLYVFVMDRFGSWKEKYEQVGDVRGLGAMVGIEFVESKAGLELCVGDNEGSEKTDYVAERTGIFNEQSMICTCLDNPFGQIRIRDTAGFALDEFNADHCA